MALANMVSTYLLNFRRLIAKINYLFITDDGRDKDQTTFSGIPVCSAVWKRLALCLNYDSILGSRHFEY